MLDSEEQKKRIRESKRAYYERNKALVKARAVEWAKNNREKLIECREKPQRKKAKAECDKRYWIHNATPEQRELRRKAIARWAKEKPHIRAENQRRRTERLNRATPTWQDREELLKIYRDCPPGFQVDHIVPIGAKSVCGLHVIYNLQYLPGSENQKKGLKIPEPNETSVPSEGRD